MDFKNTDFDQLNNALSIVEWEKLALIPNLDEMVNYFSNAVRDQIKNYTPMEVLNNKRNKKDRMLPVNLRKKIRKRQMEISHK